MRRENFIKRTWQLLCIIQDIYVYVILCRSCSVWPNPPTPKTAFTLCKAICPISSFHLCFNHLVPLHMELCLIHSTNQLHPCHINLKVSKLPSSLTRFRALVLSPVISNREEYQLAISEICFRTPTDNQHTLNQADWEGTFVLSYLTFGSLSIFLLLTQGFFVNTK